MPPSCPVAGQQAATSAHHRRAAMRAGPPTVPALGAPSDGALKYADPARAMAQLERDARLRAAGFEVVHFTWQDITRAQDKVMARIKTAFRRGAAS